jgi:hypothetical protein
MSPKILDARSHQRLSLSLGVGLFDGLSPKAEDIVRCGFAGLTPTAFEYSQGISIERHGDRSA